jgi:hypothetical protein
MRGILDNVTAAEVQAARDWANERYQRERPHSFDEYMNRVESMALRYELRTRGMGHYAAEEIQQEYEDIALTEACKGEGDDRFFSAEYLAESERDEEG